MSGLCKFCQVWHSSSCYHPARHRVAALENALRQMLERYTSLINSGDCGFWNPEEEPAVKLAREALGDAETTGTKT